MNAERRSQSAELTADKSNGNSMRLKAATISLRCVNGLHVYPVR